jgi:glycosyltransferase involved in cell wall biosynthesis
MGDPDVTVIVPTYRRAHLLGLTLPSYLQPETFELIVVDDCSPDNTEEAVKALSKTDPRVRYIRSERNLKQTHAKNLGIAAARSRYVFFGDDDSVLLPGSLARLMATFSEKHADIVGARAPYMESIEKGKDFMEAAVKLVKAGANGTARSAIIDPVSLRARFDLDPGGPIELPFVHAAFLARREMAVSIGFDEEYGGNCFREETDFLVRAKSGGARIWFEPRAAQVNLPRASAEGGAHSGSSNFVVRKLGYFKSAFENNWRFLTKNRRELRATLGLSVAPEYRQFLFLLEIVKVIVSYPLRKVTGHEF